jgi:GNAT superfamily N-acetyltransferase
MLVEKIMANIVYRQFSSAEMRDVFNVFAAALDDLLIRLGEEAWNNLEQAWERVGSLVMHLSETAEQNWVAERDGKMIAYARSTVRDDVRELTELFVLPEAQSSGVGRELLRRTFPEETMKNRIIIASPDQRSIPIYLKVGVYPRAPISYVYRENPEIIPYESDLETIAVTDSQEHLSWLNQIDREIIGFERTIDHLFLIADEKERRGYFFMRDGACVGYGYIGKRNGPIALLNNADFPTILAFAETDAAKNGRKEFGVDAILSNRVVIDYLLSRKCRIDTAFMESLMTAEPTIKLENYIPTAPAFII